MKKMILIILALIFCLSFMLWGCSEKPATYEIDFCGEKQLYDGAKDSYSAGESVKLYYSLIADDMNYTFFLDGEKLHVDYDDEKGYIIRFNMPDHDVKLECVTKNSMTFEEGITEEYYRPTRFLSLIKSYSRNSEWDEENDLLLAYAKYSGVTLHIDDTEDFPELSRALEELYGMQIRSREDEFENMISFANEALSEGGKENFRTQIMTFDIQVRRADDLAVSLLGDSYTDFGFIKDYRAFHGITFDSITGKELTLEDVITDMDGVITVIKEELNSHRTNIEFLCETAVDDFFANATYDSISWTLDYNGVTFYFMPGDICSYGTQSATVSFAAHPELFEEKYISEPKEYITQLPKDASFFADLDDTNDLEEIYCSGSYDRAGRFYSSYGLYSEIDAEYFSEDLFAYDIHPFYVKKAGGGHYLYLFCEKGEEGDCGMMLLVFDASGGKYTKIGEMNASQYFMFPDSFILPTNPDAMLLNNRDTPEQEEIYTVGNDGMPILK